MSTAVILAARKEREADIPFPLMPFGEGITLIDRTVEILRENYFTKIIIVAGYHAEMFRRFEADDVKIILNPDYEFTASLGSLMAAKDEITEDFLLIDGDTFFEKELIRRISSISSDNCLAITEESGSGDECFVETKHGFITKISKDRHRVCNFEGELIGVNRISLETFERMKELWNRSTNPLLNYEYALMDVTTPLDRPYIRFKNLIWGDVDTIKDFLILDNKLYRRLRRKENPFDEENLLKYVRNIFPDRDLSDCEITQIGGMSNKNFLVTIKNQRFVLRVPGYGSEGMVERTNEEFNALQGCKLGINPAIRYFNPENGIKLADFIENAETLNMATIQRHDNMRKIADIYSTLHNSKIRLKNEFNIIKEIEKYDLLIERSGAVMYPGWETVRKEVMELELYLNDLGVELCACHNDAVPENFIKSEDGKIYLIDWEYSGMNDPYADLAALFLESDFTEDNIDYLLLHYFNGNIPEEASKKILCYQILWDYLWSQWTVIKEANGDDFGSYGINRFNRAKQNLTILNNERKKN